MFDEYISLISSSDDNYAQHLGVMLCSVFENKSKTTKINVYIIDGGISIKNKHRLKTLGNKYDFPICYLNIDKNIYKNFYISSYINESTYYRISIPKLLDDSIEKVIYLDSDIVVKGDLYDLWKVDISNYYLAAVENPWSEYEKKHILKYPRSDYYFNAGMLVMNLKKWRSCKLSEQIIHYIKNNTDKLQFWDQDAINAIVKDNYLRLPPKWNSLNALFFMNIKETNFTQTEYFDLIKQPKIIHYAGPDKPWLFGYHNINSGIYYKYLLKTPWRFYIPKGISYKKIKCSFFLRHQTIFEILKTVKGYLRKISGKNFLRK